MKKLKCEICGSSQIVKNGDGFICNDCGCGYSAEQVRSLLVEVPDQQSAPTARPVNNTSNDQLDKLYVLARRAREQNNMENAARYYDMIALEAPNDWEANFFQVYFQCAKCKIAEIYSAAVALENCQGTVIRLIRDYAPSEQQLTAATLVFEYTKILANTLFNSAENFYIGIADSIRYQHTQEMYDRCKAATNCLYICGERIYEAFPGNEKMLKVAAKSWLEANKLCDRLVRYAADKAGLNGFSHTYYLKALECDPDLRKEAKERSRRQQEDTVLYLRRTIATLERNIAGDEQTRGLRALMYILAVASAAAMLWLFTYCLNNWIPLGEVGCFFGAILLPILFVKVALHYKRAPRDAEQQLRNYRQRLVLEERKLKKEED